MQWLHVAPSSGWVGCVAGLAPFLRQCFYCAVDERLSEVAGALGKAGIATQWGANALLVFGGRVIVRR